MATCQRCGESKDAEAFPKTTRGKPKARCLVCASIPLAERRAAAKAAYVVRCPDRVKATKQAYVKRNAEAVKQRLKDHVDANRAKIVQRNREWRANNPEVMRQAGIRWRSKEESRAMMRANTRRYQARKLHATPSWADHGKILGFYQEAAIRSAETGFPHHVDHIVPLRGKNVCGLHWEENLQVLSAPDNMKKSNSFEEAADGVSS